MKRLSLVLILFLSVFDLVGQDKPTASMLASVGNEKERNEEFSKALDGFVKLLIHLPKTTLGFVTISGDDAEIIQQRYRLVEAKIGKDPDLKRRIETPRVGVKYGKDWQMSEFWLIPEGAESPYSPNCILISCPEIHISGPTPESLADETLTYVAVVSDAVELTYEWSVVGGEVKSGQGTNNIRVSVDKPRPTSLFVTLKVGGFREDGNCMDTAEIRTTFSPK